MPRPRSLLSRWIASFTALCLVAQPLFAQMSEGGFWGERGQAARRLRETSEVEGRAAEGLRGLLAEQGALGPVRPDWMSGGPLKAFAAGPASAFPVDDRDFPALAETVSLLAGDGIVNAIHPAPPSPAPNRPAPLIVLLQDAHGLLSAQKHLASMILKLAERRPDLVVGLEGAAGEVDASPFRGPSAKVNREAGSFFLNAGLIAGPEFAAFAAPAATRFIGVEEPELYLENVEAVRVTHPRKTEISAFLDAYSKRIEALKTSLWSEGLREWDGKSRAHASGHLALADYVDFLAGLPQAGNLADLPEVAAFRRARAVERSLDFKAVERERAAILARFSERLPPSDLDALLQASLSLRVGRLTTTAYYRFFRETARRAGLAPSAYPGFEKYVDYVLQTGAIRPEVFSRQIQVLEGRVSRALCASPREAALLDISEDMALAEKLADLSMTPDEWADYLSRRDRVGELGVRVASLEGGTPRVPGDFPRLADFERFYRAAEARNEAMAGNLLRALPGEPKEGVVAVLVAGGFHAEGLSALLTRSGVCVLDVSPRLEEEDLSGGKDFLSVFVRSQTPLESLFSPAKPSLVANPALSKTPLTPQAFWLQRVLSRVSPLLLRLLPRLSPLEGEAVPPASPGQDGLIQEAAEDGSWAAAVVDPREPLENPYGVVLARAGVEPGDLGPAASRVLRGATPLLTGQTEGGVSVTVLEEPQGPSRRLAGAARVLMGRAGKFLRKAAQRVLAPRRSIAAVFLLSLAFFVSGCFQSASLVAVSAPHLSLAAAGWIWIQKDMLVNLFLVGSAVAALRFSRTGRGRKALNAGYDVKGNSARDVFLQWERILKERGSLSLSQRDVSIARNCAKRIVNDSALLPSSPKTEMDIDKLWHAFHGLGDLSLSMLEKLSAEPRRRESSQDRLKRLVMAREFEALADYALKARRALDAAANYRVLYDGYGRQWSLVKRAQGLSKGMERSRRMFGPLVEEAMKAGNGIEPHLYPSPVDLRIALDERIFSPGAKVEPVRIGNLARVWSARKHYSRVLTVPFALAKPLIVYALGAGLAALVGPQAWSAPSVAGFSSPLAGIMMAAATSLVMGTGISVFIHRFFISEGTQDPYGAAQNRRLVRAGKALRAAAARAGVRLPSDADESRRLLLRTHLKESLQAGRRELDLASEPATKVILLVARDDEQIRYYEELLATRRDRLFRPDVPVEIVRTRLEGTGTASLEASWWLEDHAAALRAKYPELGDWDVRDPRVIKVIPEGPGARGFGAPLKDRMEWSLGEDLTSFELQLLNGYKAMRTLARKKGERGREVILAPDMPYVGPTEHVRGVTLVSWWASPKRLREGRFGFVVANALGRVLKLFSADINPGKVPYLLNKYDRRRYDIKSFRNRGQKRLVFSNTDRRQVQSLAGIGVISFDSREEYEAYAAMSRMVREYIEDFRKQQAARGTDAAIPPVDWLAHVMIPLQMLSDRGNDDKAIFTYLERMGVSLPGRPPSEGEFYRGLFRRYIELHARHNRIHFSMFAPSADEADCLGPRRFEDRKSSAVADEGKVIEMESYRNRSSRSGWVGAAADWISSHRRMGHVFARAGFILGYTLLSVASGGMSAGAVSLALMAAGPAARRFFPGLPGLQRWIPIGAQVLALSASGLLPQAVLGAGVLVAGLVVLKRALPARHQGAFKAIRLLGMIAGSVLGFPGTGLAAQLLNGGTSLLIERRDTLGQVALKDLKAAGLTPTHEALIERIHQYQEANPGRIVDIDRIYAGDTLHRPPLGGAPVSVPAAPAVSATTLPSAPVPAAVPVPGVRVAPVPHNASHPFGDFLGTHAMALPGLLAAAQLLHMGWRWYVSRRSGPGKGGSSGPAGKGEMFSRDFKETLSALRAAGDSSPKGAVDARLVAGLSLPPQASLTARSFPGYAGRLMDAAAQQDGGASFALEKLVVRLKAAAVRIGAVFPEAGLRRAWEAGLRRGRWLREQPSLDAASFLVPAAGAPAILAVVDVSLPTEERSRFLAQRLRELRNAQGILLPLITNKASLDVARLKEGVAKILIAGPQTAEPWSAEEIDALFRRTGFGVLQVTSEDLRRAGQKWVDPGVRMDTAVLLRVLRSKAAEVLGRPSGSLPVRLFTDDARRFTKVSLKNERDGFVMLLVQSLFKVVKVTADYDDLLRAAASAVKSA